MKHSRNLRCLAAAMLLGGGIAAQAQAGLQVTYGSKGVQTIAFNGVTLEDVGAYGSDAFHIWHMKSTNLNGTVNEAGQYGWGESNNGESWNPSSHTETYTFSWGAVATQFVQSGNTLNLIVTETNNANSPVVFDGAEIYPFSLHFPQDPAGFSGYTQYAITTTGPGVSVADFGSGVVTEVIPNEAMALYGGWKNGGTQTYSPLMTGTYPDGIATFLPHNDLPLQPGASLSYTVSLRFTPEGTAANATDAYTSFAQTYPNQMTWTDRRIIGTAYLSSAPSEADSTQPDGFPTNPRRYFNDPTVDITTPSGLQTFQDRMLAQAASNATNGLMLNSQGIMTWDIEGEQYGQNTSYVCSPDQIATVAPEMESTVSDHASAWYGWKLDDAYFKTMRNAGLRVGVCLRPQVFAFGSNGTASQSFLSTNAAIIANLENKARFANGRWGATMFYVDSTVDTNGGTLDPAIFQQIITDLPNFLFVPEESTPRYYAYSAPFYSFIFHTDLGTPAFIYNSYPKAFGANLVNDVSASTLTMYTPQLTQSVKNGDILMGHADYWQANDPALVAIYAKAGVVGTVPVQGKPSVTWSSPPAIRYGTTLSSMQLDATASVPGSFVYTPAAGTLLAAGTDTLAVTFVPSDTTDYSNVTVATTLQVTQAAPVITWPAPGSLIAGTSLSSAQLDATASVPGTFSYSPSAGTVLPTGTSTLTAQFTPVDATDYSSVSTSTSVIVTASAPVVPTVSWGAPAAVTYGTTLGNVQLDATASVPGRFNYSPGTGALLTAGNHTLTAMFTPHDTSSYTSVLTTNTLFVVQATPVLTWPAPAALSAGTALSQGQLNATANVAGSFAYTPAAGTVPAAGTTLLTAMFLPADSLDYSAAQMSVPLTVIAAAPVNTNLAILSPSSGATLSRTVLVTGFVHLTLDSAGTYLMADGQEVGNYRLTQGPYIYPLDTTTLSNGAHVLQLWGHDIGNNVTLSAPVSILVAN
jgi:hypothetical protein